MLTHEYLLKPDHSADEAGYLPETIHALRCHNNVYAKNPSSYFNDLDAAMRFSETDHRPYLYFKSPQDSDTDLVIVQVPFANRVHPANSASEITEYVLSDAEKLPKGIKPNSFSQAIKHHLAYTALAGINEAKDNDGRSPALAVITSPSADFHQPRLSRSQRKQVRHGDLEHYAYAIADIAEELGAERLHISGYSFGAGVAARSARIQGNFDVKSLTIGEPANFKNRSLLKVIGDYTILNDVFNKTSGDPELKKVPDTGWLQDGPQARKDIARNGDGAWADSLYGNGNVRTNLQIARALGRAELLNDLQHHNGKLPLTLMTAQDSLMTKGIDGEFTEQLIDLYSSFGEDCRAHSDKLQLLNVRPLGAVAAKHIVGEIPMLYADYLARGIKHGYSA